MAFKKRLKNFIKLFWKRTLQDGMCVYHLRHTPIRFRVSLTKRAMKKYGSLPIVPNKMIFDNYMGKGYGCNGKYVTEALLARPEKFDIVWTVENPDKRRDEFPAGVRLVRYGSEAALREYYTAGFWVCNYHLVRYLNMGLVKRKGQTYIQMWHGSLGIKKIERDAKELASLENWSQLAKTNANMTDIWISNSEFESDVYTHAFWDAKDILLLGHPRNDIFFRDDIADIAVRVKHKLGVDAAEKLVLYVPTFRDDGLFPAERLSWKTLRAALCAKFSGNFRLMARLHPRMEYGIEGIIKVGEPDADILNVTEEPDIQELLAAADILVTDYSSCMFDYMLTKKPVFLLAPDIDKYNTERGFYYSLYETPFPVAETMQELEEQVAKFDALEYSNAVEQFLDGKGCVENGTAAEAVADLLISRYQRSNDI